MKIKKYTFKYTEYDIAEEIGCPHPKFQKTLTRYNITKRGLPKTEFELRGLMSTSSLHDRIPGTWEIAIVFSEKGRRWIKKLFSLLDSDITKSDWVE